METHAFWDTSDEENERPAFWRFWRRLAPKGKIGILFGSWYTQPIIERVYQRIDRARFESALDRINRFEEMLSRDGALILKFWFHLSQTDQRKRLKKDEKAHRVSPILEKFSKRYRAFSRVSREALERTNCPQVPWRVIPSANNRFRDLAVGEALAEALESRLDNKHKKWPAIRQTRSQAVSKSSVFDSVDLGLEVSPELYETRLADLQNEITEWSWRAKTKKRSLIVVFEGWDAAGKGGAIRRLTAAIDARLFQIISIAAPTDEEKAHHYLWRFWRHIPRAGKVTIYDRSWYGRVLVERIEKFAKPGEWKRAYSEINEFEDQLLERGILINKFWLHISPEEQLRRFEERKSIAYKNHKITEEDWRNREKWSAYAQAVDDMVEQTSTVQAPWTLIAGNDKKWARLQVLETVLSTLQTIG